MRQERPYGLAEEWIEYLFTEEGMLRYRRSANLAAGLFENDTLKETWDGKMRDIMVLSSSPPLPKKGKGPPWDSEN